MAARILRVRQKLRPPVPSCIRRNSQAAFAPSPQAFHARGGLTVPDNFDHLRNDGFRNPKQPQGRPLYTAKGLQTAWFDYQAAMLERVNELTAGTPLYGQEVKTIALETARDPLNAALFNHASMALNNMLYFAGISSTGPTQINQTILSKINDDFGSLDILKSEMLAMAHSMFGPGFVWLVRTTANEPTYRTRTFRLLTTYMAGSPLAGAHNRAQPVDMNTQNVAAAQAAGGLQGLSMEARRRQIEPQNIVGAMGRHSSNKPNSTSLGGVHIMPVLCVNTWQHAWLPDHGVNGKMEFLNRWWDLVNWDMVTDLSGAVKEAEKEKANGGVGSIFSH